MFEQIYICNSIKNVAVNFELTLNEILYYNKKVSSLIIMCSLANNKYNLSSHS